MKSDARAYLISKGIRISHQRLEIMDYLLKHHTHPTVEEIFMDLNPSMPTLSRTTIYNTLRLFAKQGAIQVVNIDERNARFDSHTETHAHFFCSRCGMIYDIPIPAHAYHLEECLSGNAHLHDFTINNTQIYLKGICPKCKTSEK